MLITRTFVMVFRQTMAQACCIAARCIAATFLVTGTTVANVAASASLDSFVAMELALMCLTMKLTVASATRNALMGFNVSLEVVAMLKRKLIYKGGSNKFYEFSFLR